MFSFNSLTAFQELGMNLLCGLMLDPFLDYSGVNLSSRPRDWPSNLVTVSPAIYCFPLFFTQQVLVLSFSTKLPDVLY
jgi:hypothetical protein